MMEAYDAYRMYLGIKLHFGQESYDFFRYNGAVTASKDSFMRRNDRYFFHKLGKRYDKDFQQFLVSNFAKEESISPKVLLSNGAEENYTQWKKNQQSITRIFDQELKKCLDIYENFGIMFIKESESKHPPIVKLIQQGKISVETAIILDHFLNWIDHINSEVELYDSWVWPRISRRLRKCQPFIKFNEDKCKTILKDRVESVLQKI